MLENSWSAVGNPTSALGPSGSSFGPSSLAPAGINNLFLINLTTGSLQFSSPTFIVNTSIGLHVRRNANIGELHNTRIKYTDGVYGLYLPTVILTVIWYSITHSLFLSRLKAFLLCKSFPLQPFLSST